MTGPTLTVTADRFRLAEAFTISRGSKTEAQVLIDLSGRPFAKFDGQFEASHIGDYPTEMTPHVFRSLADPGPRHRLPFASTV